MYSVSFEGNSTVLLRPIYNITHLREIAFTIHYNLNVRNNHNNVSSILLRNSYVLQYVPLFNNASESNVGTDVLSDANILLTQDSVLLGAPVTDHA